MAETDTPPAHKHPKRKKVLIIIGIVALIVAAAGAGVALRWWQTKDDGPGEFTGPTLSTDATELQDLRSDDNEEAFNEKVADILADPNLNDETRYQVLLQQGHNFFDRQEWNGAIESYLEAEQLQQTYEVAELLANTYYRAGDNSKAIEYFGKAAERIPDDNPRRAALQELFQDYINRIEAGEPLESEEPPQQ